jgi:thiamine biosynthesis lipoprotein
MPWAVKIDVLPPNISQPKLQQELQQSLDHANKVLSTYQPDTELMQFNQSPIGQWQTTSPMLFDAITTALSVSQATQGVYDVTVGAWLNYGVLANKRYQVIFQRSTKLAKHVLR